MFSTSNYKIIDLLKDKNRVVLEWSKHVEHKERITFHIINSLWQWVYKYFLSNDILSLLSSHNIHSWVLITVCEVLESSVGVSTTRQYRGVTSGRPCWALLRRRACRTRRRLADAFYGFRQRSRLCWRTSVSDKPPVQSWVWPFSR